MAVDERIQKVLVVLESDKQAAQQLQSDIARFHLSLEETRKRTVSIDTAAEELQRELAGVARSRAISVLAQQAAEGKISFQQLAKAASELGASEDEIKRVANEIGRVTENAQRAAQVAPQAGQGVLATARSAAGTAGGVLATVGGSQAASTVSSILGLTATLGPLGLTAAASVIAINAVTEAEKQRAEAARKTAADIEQIYGGAAEATTESVSQQLASLRRQRDSLQEGQDFLKGLQGVADANFGFVNLTGESVELSTVLAENRAKIDEVNRAIAIHNVQLGTQAVKENDAAAAAEEFARQLADATAKTTQNQLAEAQRAVAIQQMTKEQRDKETASIAEQITVLENYINTHALTEESYQSLSEQLNLLRTRSDELAEATLTYADVLAQLEQQQERLREGTDQVLDANTRYVEAQERVRETQEALRESSEKTGQALQRIVDERDEKLRDLEAEAAQDRLEDERKYQQDRAKTIEEAAERIQEIDEQEGRSLSAARRRRDAVAAIEAREQAEDEREREGKQADKRLKELDASLQEEERVRQQQLERQEAQTRAAAQKSIQLTTEQARAELLTKQRAAQQAVNDVQNTQVALLNIQHYFNTLMEQEAYRAGAAQVAAYRAGAGSGGTPGSYSPLPPPTGYQPTGYQPTMPVGGGGAQMVFNIFGNTTRQVLDAVHREVRKVLED